MNYAVRKTSASVAEDFFDLGWRDASLKRLPEYTNYEYQAGYFGWMKQNLSVADDGAVRWGLRLPIAGVTDGPEHCNCPF